jgi:peptide/nickel transport system ATP-binding protein
MTAAAHDARPGDSEVLAVTNLSVDFPTDDGVVHAVRGVSWAVAAGETLAVVGESGSGKSVSALAVMGLLPRNARLGGSIRFRGREILRLSERDFMDVRGKQIAMIFQDPMTSLNPVYTVGWQIAEALRAHDASLSKSAARDRSIELLKLVDIPNAEQRVDQYPHEFSGGMRQRAVIAIGMANDPDVIIADEPTTALDVTIQAQVLETLKKAQEETGAAMVLITHDLGVVAGVADRVLVMYAGRPVELGTVEEIYYSPRMPYTVGLLGALPRLDARTQERLTPIQGAPPSLINLPPGCPFGPRCPLHQARCDEEEPPLEAVDGMGHRAACWYSDILSAKGIEASDIFAATAVDAEVPLAGTALGGEEADLEALGAAAAAEKIRGRAGRRAATKATKAAAKPAPTRRPGPRDDGS